MISTPSPSVSVMIPPRKLSQNHQLALQQSHRNNLPMTIDRTVIDHRYPNENPVGASWGSAGATSN